MTGIEMQSPALVGSIVCSVHQACGMFLSEQNGMCADPVLNGKRIVTLLDGKVVNADLD